MLEGYLLRNIIEIVKGELSLNNNPPLKSIHISIGKFYPIDSEAFQQSFKVAAKENFLTDVELKIMRPSLTAQCNLCKNKFEIKNFTFFCPKCKGQNLYLVSGDELRIDFLEVD